MERALIALGGNVGDVPRTIAQALAALGDSDVREVAVSPLMASRPMGSGAGAPFVNAAARVETSLPPEMLLARLHEIEANLGRVRAAHWGPRPIDLDLITYGDLTRQEGPVLLPHPGCWWRRFVLDPIVAIAPETVHPQTGETFAALREALLPRPLPVTMMKRAGPDLLEEINRRLGPAATEIRWAREEEAAAIRFAPGTTVSSPAERSVGMPGDDGEVVEKALAVLTAATDEPETL